MPEPVLRGDFLPGEPPNDTIFYTEFGFTAKLQKQVYSSE